MRQKLRACAITLALLGSVDLAAAQGLTRHEKITLSPPQAEALSKGLAGQPTQSLPAGSQAQIGSKLPDSLQAQPLPGSVTGQVPAAKNYLFVKLPDRVLLIDPDDMMVAEIVPDTATTGSGGSDMGGTTGGVRK